MATRKVSGEENMDLKSMLVNVSKSVALKINRSVDIQLARLVGSV